MGFTRKGHATPSCGGAANGCAAPTPPSLPPTEMAGLSTVWMYQRPRRAAEGGASLEERGAAHGRKGSGRHSAVREGRSSIFLRFAVDIPPGVCYIGTMQRKLGAYRYVPCRFLLHRSLLYCQHTVRVICVAEMQNGY